MDEDVRVEFVVPSLQQQWRPSPLPRARARQKKCETPLWRETCASSPSPPLQDVNTDTDVHTSIPSNRAPHPEGAPSGRWIPLLSSLALEGESDGIPVSLMIVAHVTYRSNLLRCCYNRWEHRWTAREELRQRQLYFAKELYMQRLRIILFRAWQWCLARRRQQRERQALASQMARRLPLRTVMRAWRRFATRCKERATVMEAMAASRKAELFRRYFTHWFRHVSRRSLAARLSICSSHQLYEIRFDAWQRWLSFHKGRALRCCVIAVHCPSAWHRFSRACDTAPCSRRALPFASLDALTRLSLHASWIQWLRVTWWRRGERLLRYAHCVNYLTIRSQHCRLGQTWQRWLLRTATSAQAKRQEADLRRRYWAPWRAYAYTGALSKAVGSRHMATCAAHLFEWWLQRAVRRKAWQEDDTRAKHYFSSVVASHSTERAFRWWTNRHRRRIRVREMRAVARIAHLSLLRHVGLRRLVDPVVSFAAGCQVVSERVMGDGAREFDDTGCRMMDPSALPRRPLTMPIPLQPSCGLQGDGCDGRDAEIRRGAQMPPLKSVGLEGSVVSQRCGTRIREVGTDDMTSHEEIVATATQATGLTCGDSRAPVVQGLPASVQVVYVPVQWPPIGCVGDNFGTREHSSAVGVRSAGCTPRSHPDAHARSPQEIPHDHQSTCAGWMPAPVKPADRQHTTPFMPVLPHVDDAGAPVRSAAMHATQLAEPLFSTMERMPRNAVPATHVGEVDRAPRSLAEIERQGRHLVDTYREMKQLEPSEEAELLAVAEELRAREAAMSSGVIAEHGRPMTERVDELKRRRQWLLGRREKRQQKRAEVAQLAQTLQRRRDYERFTSDSEKSFTAR